MRFGAGRALQGGQDLPGGRDLAGGPRAVAVGRGALGPAKAK